MRVAKGGELRGRGFVRTSFSGCLRNGIYIFYPASPKHPQRRGAAFANPIHPTDIVVAADGIAYRIMHRDARTRPGPLRHRPSQDRLSTPKTGLIK